jgi:hypothetical protein
MFKVIILFVWLFLLVDVHPTWGAIVSSRFQPQPQPAKHPGPGSTPPLRTSFRRAGPLQPHPAQHPAGQPGVPLVWNGGRLNRYDGYRFKVYKHDIDDPSSLGANFIRALYEDPSGFLWVGTEGGGLNRFDPQTEQFTRYQNDPDNPSSLSDNTVSVIVPGSMEAGSGRPWLEPLRS